MLPAGAIACLCASLAPVQARYWHRSRGACCLQVWILLIWQRHGRGLRHLILVLLHGCLVNLELWWSERWRCDEFQSWVADQLSRQPQERLLEVVVGLRRDVVVLQVLFAVEGDGLGLDFALLHVDLVAREHDWDVLAHGRGRDASLARSCR